MFSGVRLVDFSDKIINSIKKHLYSPACYCASCIVTCCVLIYVFVMICVLNSESDYRGSVSSPVSVKTLEIAAYINSHSNEFKLIIQPTFTIVG